jgi:hypothetical protein
MAREASNVLVLNFGRKIGISQSEADSSSRAPIRARQRPRVILGWPLWTALLLNTRPGLSASRREALPHAKAVRNWSSASSVKCAAKSTAIHYFAVLLRCSLAVGLKKLGQAARVVQRAVHGAEQRQIAQLVTAVNVALRKDVAAHHHCFRLTPGLWS